jgi:hypothetical protein
MTESVDAVNHLWDVVFVVEICQFKNEDLLYNKRAERG